MSASVSMVSLNWDGSIMPYAECTAGVHGEGTPSVDTAGLWAGGGVITPMHDNYDSGDDLRVLLRALATAGSFFPGVDIYADGFLCGDSLNEGEGRLADCGGAAVPLLGAGWIKLGGNVGEAFADALRLSDALDDVPDLVVDSRQFGQKWNRHSRDYGLDVGNAEARAWYARRIEQVRNSPEQVRQGAYHPNGGGGSDHLFFVSGSDLLITQADGTFVTMFPMGPDGTRWFNNANQLG